MKGSSISYIIMTAFAAVVMVSFSTAVMAQDLMFPENINVQDFAQYPAMTEWTTLPLAPSRITQVMTI